MAVMRGGSLLSFCLAVFASIGCSADENIDSAKSCEAPTEGAPGPVCNGTDVFVAYCSGGVCHHAGCDAAGGLNLASPGVADRLAGVQSTCNGRLYVDPNDVDRSFLLEKLQSDMPECGGSRMPLVGTPLPPETIQCVRDWMVTQLH